MNNIKYSYMDHWEIITPQGLSKPNVRRSYMERYLKQIAALGFQGLDMFAFSIPMYSRMFGGSFKDFEKFLQDIGMEKVSGLFNCYIGEHPNERFHDPATHDALIGQFRMFCEMAKGTGVETMIFMPAVSYCYVEPVTDDKIHHMADFANKVGKMLMEDYGIHLSCHHEFWSGLREKWAIDKFYEWTDPKYVFFFCDTAQHVIAGVDPVELYNQLADRTWGFHLKDTRNTDDTYYRIPPDTELMVPDVPRWFYEAGSGKGLCDFPALYRAIRKNNYSGWISVEHDKADIEGKSFADCTAVSKWYIENVLNPILKEEK
ncbi:MAG: TIM barrel protein [Oscillospiraceae bacterium]|nr:TIM barrel protein [Oscillospiraceae bacterium]